MRRAAPGLVFALIAGCSAEPEATAFERSCRGERVLECDPYEWSVVRGAELTPARIRPGDPEARARLRVAYEACAMRPGPARVQLLVRLDLDADVRVVDLGIAVADDGTGADARADDGVIEAALGNPFGREIPPDAAIAIRVVPVIAGCTGDALEIDYETGEPFLPPTP